MSEGLTTGTAEAQGSDEVARDQADPRGHGSALALLAKQHREE